MHIGHRNPNYAYFMHSEKLAVVVEEKDRGVMVHRSLKPTRPVLWSRSRPFWPEPEPGKKGRPRLQLYSSNSSYDPMFKLTFKKRNKQNC